ncbi:hypothetical protein F4808DRAFT_421526 [Astrocystis sublimbata]|nr:hypothetical protein F4808DRAFT_421526 [Astrocystis sublimbata]
MYTTKALVALTVLADASLAQTYIRPSLCSSLINDLNVAAPTLPATLSSAYGYYYSMEPNADVLLADPKSYVAEVCSVLPKLPEDVLPAFASWGVALLDFASNTIEAYDAIITSCITTGTAAASVTSYLHSIVSSPEALCQPTSSPSRGNGTASITPYPTSTPAPAPTGSNSTVPGTGVPTTSVPVAAAARPTGLLAGAAAIGGLLGAVALL